jgi:hypothetical protein
MISPYKLSATQIIVDCRFTIADLKTAVLVLQIDNRQSKIANALGR